MIEILEMADFIDFIVTYVNANVMLTKRLKQLVSNAWLETKEKKYMYCFFSNSPSQYYDHDYIFIFKRLYIIILNNCIWNMYMSIYITCVQNCFSWSGNNPFEADFEVHIWC